MKGFDPFDQDFFNPSANAEDARIFGAHYTPPPNVIQHGVSFLVARYPKSGGDGQPVEVWSSRWPAQFYEVRAQDSEDSLRNLKLAYTLATASSGGQMAATLADAIASGALTLVRSTPLKTSVDTRTTGE